MLIVMDSTKAIGFVALKDIGIGEELVFDY